MPSSQERSKRRWMGKEPAPKKRARSVADLMTVYDRYYTVDKVLWKIAAVQLGKSYNLPVIAECVGTLNP
jgi:hypothetical protein